MSFIPIISVVIPSYNQGIFLDACIQSVIQQNYPRLEVIVMDGGSTDNSTNVIKKHANLFKYWQSEPDGGQTRAIVAGFEKADGELLTWINSDDVLLPGSLLLSAEAYVKQFNADVFYGDHYVLDHTGSVVEKYFHPRYFNDLAWLTGPYIAQPGTLFTRRIWDKVGGADVNMHCAFDYDLWYRFMAAKARFVHVGGFVAGFRKHSESKGAKWLERYQQEYELLNRRYAAQFGNPLTRKVARLLLMGLQTVSGAYMRTLAFRLLKHRRLHAYEAQ